jgi:hypothetical protein
MDTNQKILIFGGIAVLVLAIGLTVYVLRFRNKSSDKFNILTDPLTAPSYNLREKDCGTSYSEGTGGKYGLTPEFNKDLTVCNFVNKYEKNTVFPQLECNLEPSLLYNQTAYEIPAKQICNVLYQYHQQYFENMWSGLGECELYFEEQGKTCKDIKVKTI